MKTIRLALLLAACASLAGCDGWPTSLDNRASGNLTFRYHHRLYDQWSGWAPVLRGNAVLLAREHRMRDISGLEITQGGLTYRYGTRALAPVHGLCAGSSSCALVYRGAGRLEARTAPLPDAQMR
ncbi:hypothetical protein EDF58_106222 [Novosphingobium sp. PhB57]|jgi:hypothetical protein|uniref:hypothetical protein n=1 Tax=unclassified Novosphingobium TaxID=2644732 RepID=UPI0010462E62|nr:hypothetical protein [Novosphingobium sp. PhB57]TCU55932.1 hypothetical protein EDF58_106222 [Novosphingobium sp. PhB57]